jgi:hypothetical protein
MLTDENSLRCRRSNGSFRAWFLSYGAARLFAADPANVAYHNDVPQMC